MSYCRWSTDHFQCDAYVYESACGWEIHVAGRRRDWKKAGMVLPDRMLPRHTGDAEEDAVNVAEWMVREHRFSRLMDDPRWDDDDFVGWVDVPEPWAGKSFTVASPGEAAAILLAMWGDGCYVPFSAIQALQKEQAEIDNADQAD